MIFWVYHMTTVTRDARGNRSNVKPRSRWQSARGGPKKLICIKQHLYKGGGESSLLVLMVCFDRFSSTFFYTFCQPLLSRCTMNEGCKNGSNFMKKGLIYTQKLTRKIETPKWNFLCRNSFHPWPIPNLEFKI